jgi:hypothetical protein
MDDATHEREERPRETREMGRGRLTRKGVDNRHEKWACGKAIKNAKHPEI